jgi:lipopolysaccharide/colanic/teichoic acid biosynthesis glycosyltransferase
MIAVERPSMSASRYPDWIKRAFDLTISAFLGILLLPFGLVVALVVRINSPGPAFFLQQRVGRKGQLFWLYKFRSMRAGKSGPNVTAGGDHRITPLGRILRNWKIDELPQLINVVRGDMSLVGPRPEVPEYVERYNDEQRQVLTVRPGITGIAQLEFRNEEKMLEGKPDAQAYYLSDIMPRKLELDMRYVRELSLGLDIKILFRTAAAVLRR